MLKLLLSQDQNALKDAIDKALSPHDQAIKDIVNFIKQVRKRHDQASSNGSRTQWNSESASANEP
jgi:hypothetical protein